MGVPPNPQLDNFSIYFPWLWGIPILGLLHIYSWIGASLVALEMITTLYIQKAMDIHRFPVRK
jgi:hypothetical protein